MASPTQWHFSPFEPKKKLLHAAIGGRTRKKKKRNWLGRTDEADGGEHGVLQQPWQYAIAEPHRQDHMAIVLLPASARSLRQSKRKYIGKFIWIIQRVNTVQASLNFPSSIFHIIIVKKRLSDPR